MSITLLRHFPEHRHRRLPQPRDIRPHRRELLPLTAVDVRQDLIRPHLDLVGELGAFGFVGALPLGAVQALKLLVAGEARDVVGARVPTLTNRHQEVALGSGVARTGRRRVLGGPRPRSAPSTCRREACNAGPRVFVSIALHWQGVNVECVPRKTASVSWPPIIPMMQGTTIFVAHSDGRPGCGTFGRYGRTLGSVSIMLPR
jgi:hypothetical protein